MLPNGLSKKTYLRVSNDGSTGRKENGVDETPDSIKVIVQRPFNPAFLGICIHF
jgi:hypothetical protein